MDSQASVTAWIADLKAGEAGAAEQLWERYFHRLVGFARRKLASSARRVADEEDVALSAFKSLCLGAADGRFPQLCDRDNLWPLLVVLTSHKAQDLVKSERRLKRGGGGIVRTEASRPAIKGNAAGLEEVLSREPSPEFATLMAEHCESLLHQLDPQHRNIAELKLEGHSNHEIAERLHCGLRTVERRLELIRRVWQEAGEGR